MDDTDRMTDKGKTSTIQTITDRRTYRRKEKQLDGLWTLSVFFKEMQAVRLKVKLKEERSTEGRGDGMINIGSRASFPYHVLNIAQQGTVECYGSRCSHHQPTQNKILKILITH